MAAQYLQLLMLQIRKIVDGKSGASYVTLLSSKGRSQHISYSYMSMIFGLNNKGCRQLLRSWGGGGGGGLASTSSFLHVTRAK